MSAAEPDKLRLGGMALRNGLLVHGPTHWAAAVRTRDGAVKAASGRKPDLGGKASEKIPGVRGVTKLAEAMAVIPLVKRALPEAKLPMQDVRTLATMAGAALIGQAIRSAGARTIGRELAVGVVSAAPALLALRGGDLAAYHGVEHKSIAAYETGGEAVDATKEHDRCGSNLVAPMLDGCGRGQRGGAPGRPEGSGGRGGGGPGQRRGGGRGVRLVRAQRGHRALARAAQARATRSSGSWARASPPTSSSRSVAPRWTRSCASRAWHSRIDPAMATPAQRTRLAPEVFRLPVERLRAGYYSDAYFTLTKELLEAEGRHPRVTMQVVPEAAAPCWAASTRRWRVLRAVLGPPRPGRRLGAGLRRARGARAVRGRRGRAVGDGHDRRGRLQPVRPPRDRVPGLDGAAHAGDEERARGRGGGGRQADPVLPGSPRPLARADRRRLGRARGRRDRRVHRRPGLVVGRHSAWAPCPTR